MLKLSVQKLLATKSTKSHKKGERQQRETAETVAQSLASYDTFSCIFVFFVAIPTSAWTSAKPIVGYVVIVRHLVAIVSICGGG